MSKLIDEIRKFQQNATRPANMEMASFRGDLTYLRTVGTKQYHFEARLGASVDIDEDLQGFSDSDVFTEVLKTVRHRVAEEIFGEFRQPLLKLRQRAAARGDRESLELVDGILDGMFKI